MRSLGSPNWKSREGAEIAGSVFAYGIFLGWRKSPETLNQNLWGFTLALTQPVSPLLSLKRDNTYLTGLPWWFHGKESACLCRRRELEFWSRKSLGEGNGNPLQYSCLENSMDRGGWQATVCGVAKSQTRLNN